MKLLFDESLSPRLVSLLCDLFPESESALRNGLAGAGDRMILKYAASGGFILITTDADFERLLPEVPDSRVVVLLSCDYPTGIAAEVLRRNAIRIVELSRSEEHLIVLLRRLPAPLIPWRNPRWRPGGKPRDNRLLPCSG